MNTYLKAALITLWMIVLTFGTLEIGATITFAEKLISEKGIRVVNALIDDNARNYSTGDFTNGSAIAEISPRAYYLYINAPLSGTDAGIQVTPEGYRNGKETITPQFNGIRILAMGGSTTYGWLLKDYKDTWPAQLEKMLKKKFPFPVQVVNAGLPAGTSAEELVDYALRDQFIHPDIVIIHNGGNDAHPLFYADYRPDYSNYRSTVGGSIHARPGEQSFLQHSALLRLVYAVWLQNQNVGSVQTQPTTAPSVNEALANVRKNEPTGFEHNVETLLTIIKSNGATPVIFPFYLASKEVFPLVPKDLRYAEETYAPLTLGIEKNKAVLHEIAQRDHIPLFELPENSIPLNNFFDHCHLKAPGETIKAEFLAKKLAPIIEAKARQKSLPIQGP